MHAKTGHESDLTVQPRNGGSQAPAPSWAAPTLWATNTRERTGDAVTASVWGNTRPIGHVLPHPLQSTNTSEPAITTVQGLFEVAEQDWLHALEPYIEQLSPEELLALYDDIHSIRSGTSYTSSSSEVRSRITLLASLLHTQDAKIFYETNPSGKWMGKYEYHVFLNSTINEFQLLLDSPNPDVTQLNILLSRALQGIGLTMDSTFLLFNKPESEAFISSVVDDLKKFYERLEALSATTEWDSPEIKEFKNNLYMRVAHFRAILMINYIVYYSGTEQEGNILLDLAIREIQPSLCPDGDTGYYTNMAECNRELFNAKCALADRDNHERRDAAMVPLEKRLEIMTGRVWADIQTLFWRNIPADWQYINDDFLELLAAIVRLDTHLPTEHLVEWLDILLSATTQTGRQMGHRNEREHAFSLLLIESILEKLASDRRTISENDIAQTLEKLSKYLLQSYYGDTMIEELSRLNLQIANIYGKVYASQLQEVMKHQSREGERVNEEITTWPNFALLQLGKAAFCQGIYAINDRERILQHSTPFLETVARAYMWTHDLVPRDSAYDYAERWLGLLNDRWLGWNSHVTEFIESKQSQAIDRLEKIPTPDSIERVPSYIKDICKEISDHFYGFFHVEIVPYGARPQAMGDITIQKFDLCYGFELVLESDSLKKSSRETFTQNEIPALRQEINTLLMRCFSHICPPQSAGKLRQIERFLPGSTASLASWYERLILYPPKLALHVQEKAVIQRLCGGAQGGVSASTKSGGDYQSGIEIIPRGVECLLRLMDRITGRTYGPGPFQQTEAIYDRDGQKIQIGLFDALDIFGIYIPFMQQQLAEIMKEMRGLKIGFSINVRGDELESPEYMRTFEDLLKRNQIDPKLVTIEVLEEHINLESPIVIGNLRRFKALGTKLSLDDFWTMKSWEARLHALIKLDLKPNEIKLDGMYVPFLTGSDEQFWLLQNTIQSYRGLGIDIVLEWVENDEQLKRAVDAGITVIQWYYYHKPEAITAFRQQLAVRQTRSRTRNVICDIGPNCPANCEHLQ